MGKGRKVGALYTSPRGGPTSCCCGVLIRGSTGQRCRDGRSSAAGPKRQQRKYTFTKIAGKSLFGRCCNKDDPSFRTWRACCARARAGGAAARRRVAKRAQRTQIRVGKTRGICRFSADRDRHRQTNAAGDCSPACLGAPGASREVCGSTALFGSTEASGQETERGLQGRE